LLRIWAVLISIILVIALDLGGFNASQAKVAENAQTDLKDLLKDPLKDPLKDVVQDKEACRSLVIDYAYHRDHGHASELAKFVYRRRPTHRDGQQNTGPRSH